MASITPGASDFLNPLAAGTAAAGAAGVGTSSSSMISRMSFQRLVLFAVARLGIYIFKLFEDGNAVVEYKQKSEFHFMVISAACLVIPPIFYAIFLVGQNLTKDDVLDTSELGTKTVNGLLLIPWQIKRHLDVLHFAAQRVCIWRKPNKSEEQDLQSMQRTAEILEFFEDIYAGFMQILLQLYIYLSFTATLEKTTNMNFIQNELIASSFSVLSMLIAVRRRDDGPLTSFLSFFGWSSLIMSRIFVFSLAATQIGVVLPLLLLVHVLAVSIWVYTIAIESYMASTASPTEETMQWTDKRKRGSIAVMVTLFFGIPSLVIWPIMFQLKERRRPLIFLMVITLENLLLLGTWFVSFGKSGKILDTHETILVSVIVVTTLAGVFFLLIYTLCKPKYTDQVVLYEIRESRSHDVPSFSRLNGINSRAFNATQYGIYYEFCDLVFKLPSTHKLASDLQEIRKLTADLDNEPVTTPVTIAPVTSSSDNQNNVSS